MRQLSTDMAVAILAAAVLGALGGHYLQQRQPAGIWLLSLAGLALYYMVMRCAVLSALIEYRKRSRE